MKLLGTLERDGSHWIARIPVVDGVTQGCTCSEAILMAGDWVQSLVDVYHMRPCIVTTIPQLEGQVRSFYIRTTPSTAVISFVLRRLRENARLSLADVAQRLGQSSPNAYARYEQGAAVPGVAQLDRLIHAVAPGRDLTLSL